MTGTGLLVLHLASPLVYAAKEGPAPSSPAADAPEFAAAAGSDRLFAYSEESFPRSRKAPSGQERLASPALLFSASAAAVEGGGGTFELRAEDYFFSQWAAGDGIGALDGLDSFAEAVRAEAEDRNVSTEGPWMLRVLAEDGGARFQGLKAISA